MYQRAIDSGVAMICVGTDVRSSREAVEFARTHENVWAIVGIHPHEAAINHVNDIRQLLTKDHDIIIGVGEIGLDYYYDHSPRSVQQQTLEAQIQLALEFAVPISFHVREAFDDFWPILDNFRGVKGVLHSFTDSQANLDEGFSRGLYVGINGISTFTKDEAQYQLYRQLPLKQMLLETDAPFLTPPPFRGKMNEPRYVRLVAEFWARERQVPFDEIAWATTANARQLFSI